MALEPLFADLRQGSRNAAGVRWQISVCAHLLVSARAGDLDLVALTPEGYEDADGESRDGSRTYIQMKELDAGRGVMNPSRVAEALAHAEASARGGRIILITDGSLGSGLGFTGWEHTLSEGLGDGLGRVRSGLLWRGYTATEADGILSRAHLVWLPYPIRRETERLLAEATGTHPTVAALAVSQLTESIGRLSADQRLRTASTAASIHVGDVDAALTDIQDTVDPGGLGQAVADGVCTPVDFIAPEVVEARVFYLGVDGRPGHIAADLDVVRPEELTACSEGLQDERSVLFVGPSGAGKSVLLWRSARDLVPGARALRVLRVETDADARAMARHVRLQRPTEASPVLVVADDLGRPDTAGWIRGARLLREIPGVYLLGAARSEDFTPSLAVGATRIVEPRLTEAVSIDLGIRLGAQGIQLRMDSIEAFHRSGGLMMEFVALLTTGRRLREVLATQVNGLRDPARRLQRDAARLVTTAHLLGLALDTDRLSAELLDGRRSASRASSDPPTSDPAMSDRIAGGPCTGDQAVAAPAAPKGSPAHTQSEGWVPDESDVGDALAVLRDEHVAVGTGDTWRGLHELRSTIISELLHQNPPPRLTSTLVSLARVVAPAQAGWMLRRVAELFPRSLEEVVAALGKAVARDATATTLATFLEGAERADNALYAAATLPLLERAARRVGGNLTVDMLAMFVYPMRNQDFALVPMNTVLDRAVDAIRPVAHAMPARADFDTTLVAACDGISPDAMTHILRTADLVEATRLLEAGREHFKAPAEAVSNLLARAADPHDARTAAEWSRLVAACVAHLSHDRLVAATGDVLHRARTVATADPYSLDLSVESLDFPLDDERGLEETHSGTVPTDRAVRPSERRITAQLIRLLPPDTDDAATLPWDLPPKSEDGLNRSTVASLERIKDACPEIEQFRITTVTASGAPYVFRDFEPGHKDMQRARFIDRSSARRNVGYQAGLRRITSSHTWTEVVRAQAGVAADLVAATAVAPLRLKPGDNVRRRREWQAGLDDIRKRLAAIRPPPLPAEAADVSTQAHDDDRDRADDPTTKALRGVVQALDVAALTGEAHTGRPLALAVSLREAALELEDARRNTQPVVVGFGSVLPTELSDHLRRVADLVAALQVEPGLVRLVRADAPLESAQAICDRIRHDVNEQAREALSAVLAGISGATYAQVFDPNPATWGLQPTAWVISVPGDLLDQALETLQTLGEGVRELLGPHTVVLPVVTEDPSSPDDEARPITISLGVAYQLATHLSRDAFILPPDTARTWAEAAGHTTLNEATSHLDAAGRLVERSTELARRRMRKLADPPGHPPALPPALTPRPAASAGSPGTTHPAYAHVTAPGPDEALACLQRHVDAEESGATTTYLAEVVFRSVTGKPHDDESLPIVGWMSILHLDMLQSTLEHGPPSASPPAALDE